MMPQRGEMWPLIGVLSILTCMHNYYYKLNLNHFNPTKLYQLNSHDPFTYPHSSRLFINTFCLYSYAYSRYFI